MGTHERFGARVERSLRGIDVPATYPIPLARDDFCDARWDFRPSSGPGPYGTVLAVAPVEPFILVDESYVDAVRREEGVVFFSRKSRLHEPSIATYSLTTLQAMGEVQFQGSTVLDLGSSDGVLSAASLDRGASHAVGLDCDRRFERFFRWVAKHNGARDKMRFIHGDVTDPQRALEDIPANDIDILLANLGEMYGTEVSDGVIEIIDSLPNLSVFVGGGYARDKENPHLDSSRMLQALHDRKFGDPSEYLTPGDHLAFVCRR